VVARPDDGNIMKLICTVAVVFGSMAILIWHTSYSKQINVGDVSSSICEKVIEKLGLVL